MLPCELSMVAEAARHDASIAVSLRLGACELIF
jgi:hypothetical protein